jgi:hypothetical protein
MKPFETIEDLCVHCYKKNIRFSKRQAMSFISRSKLENLVAQNKIRAEKKNSSQNGKWECNAGDVLWYASKKTRD